MKSLLLPEREGIYKALLTPQHARREGTEAQAAELMRAVKQEAAMIASLRHPNIVLFMGALLALMRCLLMAAARRTGQRVSDRW